MLGQFAPTHLWLVLGVLILCPPVSWSAALLRPTEWAQDGRGFKARSGRVSKGRPGEALLVLMLDVVSKYGIRNPKDLLLEFSLEPPGVQMDSLFQAATQLPGDRGVARPPQGPWERGCCWRKMMPVDVPYLFLNPLGEPFSE